MDTKVILGTAFVTDKGDWTKGTSYEENDIVHTTDGVYMSLVDNNTADTTDTASWRVWVNKEDINTVVKNAEAATKAANTAATTIDDKIATKAAQTDLDATNEVVATKAAQTDLDVLKASTEASIEELQNTKVDYDVLAASIYPSYTLEESSNPSFDVDTKSYAFLQYRKAMGGYMMYFKNGKAYAAKLNRTNWNKFADGADASSVASKCETMVYLPTCYFHAADQTMHFSGLTQRSGDKSFASPSWVGAYEMYVDDSSVGHSRPDVSPSHSQTVSTFWQCAQNLHSNAGLANYGFHCLINCLFQLGYGTLDSQSAVGSGGNTTSWETWRDVAMGYGRSIGDGSGTAATSMSGQNCVKLFGFEDLWAKLWEFRPGIRFYYSDSVRHAVVYDGNVVSNTATGRDFTVPLMNAEGEYVTKMQLGEYWDMVPIAVGGSDTTNYCDGGYDASEGELMFVGGVAIDGARCGVTDTRSLYGFSYSWTGVGARLAFYGEPEIVSGSELVAMVGA